VIDLLIPTLGNREPQGLRHIPWSYEYHESREKPWAVAANKLLDGAKNDVLFMDDDVTLLEGAFWYMDWVYPYGDIFGFALITADGGLEPGPVCVGVKDGSVSIYAEPLAFGVTCYTAHVSSSLIYIKKRVIDAGVRFPIWGDNGRYEDVAFNLSAWLKGFRVIYTPSIAVHQHGAEKGQAASSNIPALNRWMVEHNIAAAIQEGKIPHGRIGLSPLQSPEDFGSLRPFAANC